MKHEIFIVYDNYKYAFSTTNNLLILTMQENNVLLKNNSMLLNLKTKQRVGSSIIGEEFISSYEYGVRLMNGVNY